MSLIALGQLGKQWKSWVRSSGELELWRVVASGQYQASPTAVTGEAETKLPCGGCFHGVKSLCRPFQLYHSVVAFLHNVQWLANPIG